MVEFLVGGLVAVVGVCIGATVNIVTHSIERADEKNPNTTGARLRRDAREREQAEQDDSKTPARDQDEASAARTYRNVQHSIRTTPIPALTPNQEKSA